MRRLLWLIAILTIILTYQSFAEEDGSPADMEYVQQYDSYGDPGDGLSHRDAAALVAEHLVPAYAGEANDWADWRIVFYQLKALAGAECYAFSVQENIDEEYVEVLDVAVTLEGDAYLWDETAGQYVLFGNIDPAHEVASPCAYLLHADDVFEDMDAYLSLQLGDGTYIAESISADGAVFIKNQAFEYLPEIDDGFFDTCALLVDATGDVQGLEVAIEPAYSAYMGQTVYNLTWFSGEGESARGYAAIALSCEEYALVYGIGIRADSSAQYAQKILEAFNSLALVAQ